MIIVGNRLHVELEPRFWRRYQLLRCKAPAGFYFRWHLIAGPLVVGWWSVPHRRWWQGWRA